MKIFNSLTCSYASGIQSSIFKMVFFIKKQWVIATLPFLFISSFSQAQFYTAAALGIVANGTDQTGNINAALARADVKTIWFNNSIAGVPEADFVVTGTVAVPAGKVLKFEAYNVLVGSGIINGGIIDASLRDRIFDTALTVNAVAVSHEWFSAKWYGAKGDGTTDDYKPIQLSINACIRNDIQKLIIPHGIYKITRPLIERGQTSNFFTLDFNGETTVWGTGTSIKPSFNNTFALGIQLGKGCKVRNMNFTGTFTPPNPPDLYDYFTLPFNSFTDGVSRDQQYSPYAGIVIDPFRNLPGDGLPADGGYPGLSGQYGIAFPSGSINTVSGSSATSIEDVSVFNFVVGILSSPNGTTQGSDFAKISRVQIGFCKLGISGCQDQEKTNVVDGLVCSNNTHTIFATGLYGKENSNWAGNWNINNVNIAGAVVRFIFNLQSGLFPSYINNVYAENLGSFGTMMASNTVINSLASQVTNCMFNFEYYTFAGFQTLATTNKGITFKNCLFRYYGTNAPMIFDCGVTNVGSTFEDCSFSGVPVQLGILTAGGTTIVPNIYTNCNAGPIRFGLNVNQVGTKGFDGLLYDNNYTITDHVAEANNNLTEKYSLNEKEDFVNFIDNTTNHTITIASHSTTFTAGNTNAYSVGGLIIFSSSLSPAYAAYVGCGIVKTITPGTGTTGTIYVENISKGVVSGSSYTVSCITAAIHGGTFMGDITNGNTIANVAPDWGALPANFVGGFIKAPYNNSTWGWVKIIAYNAATKTYTTLGNNGSVFSVTGTALYFNNGATKTVSTSSEANQTIASATNPVIFYKGELITQLDKSDLSKTYICSQTGYNKLSLAPVGETRLGVIQIATTWNPNNNYGPVLTGFGNTAGGYWSLSLNTTGNANTSFGNASLTNNTIGSANTSVGSDALSTNTTGSNNSGFGFDALNVNTTGINNTAVGFEALTESIIGNENTAIGNQAMEASELGSNNLAVGSYALSSNYDGSNNTAIGYNSLNMNSHGNNNIGVGNNSLVTNVTSSNNTAIGSGADISVDGLTNATALGYNTVVTQSNNMEFGNSSITGWGFGTAIPTATKVFIVGTTAANGNGAYLSAGGTWTNASDKNLKEDLTLIDGNEILRKISRLDISRWKYKGTNEYHIGPMAQDFYKAFGLGNDDKHISTIDPSGISLIAIQQLTKEIEVLKKEVAALQAEIRKK